MSVLASIASGMQGALLLARGRAEGVRFVEGDRVAAIRSFWAIPLCLPAVICLKLLDWIGGPVPADAPLVLCRYLLVFLDGWLVFAWVSFHLVSILHKQALWPRCLAVWAYCSVIENTMIAIGALPGALGAPSIIAEASGLITIGWALWLEWFGIRVSLQVGPMTAITLVAVDFAIGVVMMSLGSLAG